MSYIYIYIERERERERLMKKEKKLMSYVSKANKKKHVVKGK